MLVLKRKQIIMVTMFTFLSVFSFMFTTANKDTKEVIKPTVSLPVSRKNNNIRCRPWCSR